MRHLEIMTRTPAMPSSISCRRARRRARSSNALLLALAFALLLLGACGGGSAGSESGGLAFRAVWEPPPAPQGQEGCGTPGPTPTPGGFGIPIPNAVKLIQIVVRSAEGTDCCIRLDADEDRRSVALLDVPAGAATVTITGFPDEAYAAALSVPACQLDPSAPNPPSRACDGGRQGQPNPSFQSDEHNVTILSAGSTNAGEIQIYSLPFVVFGNCPTAELVPPPNRVTSTASVAVTVADARGDIDCGTVRALFVQGGREIGTNLQPFPCSDRTPGIQPCSCPPLLDVAGCRGENAEAAEDLQPGEALVRIHARSCDGRSITFEYPFTYGPASPTVTATETSVPPSPTAPSVTPSSTATATETSTPSPSATATETSTPSPSATATETATPSATATETWTQTPTPTVEVVLRIVAGPVTGNMATISVSIEVPMAVEVAELDQRIGFDADEFEIQDCTPNDALQDRFDSSIECNGTCILHAIIVPNATPIPTSTLYDCLALVSTSGALTCESQVVRDPLGQDLPVRCIPGEIEVP
jgi:hypothetical protein